MSEASPNNALLLFVWVGVCAFVLLLVHIYIYIYIYHIINYISLIFSTVWLIASGLNGV